MDLASFLLKTFPTAEYASGRSEIVMKCPFCGDSPNPRSKHFYISLASGKPHLYNCFKCNEKGVLTSKVLRRMSVYDAEASYELDLYNKKIEENSDYKIYKSYTHNLINSIQDNDISRLKLKYINKRLGTNLSYADLERLKICLNLNDVLYDKRNNIRVLSRNENIVNQLSNYFIGAISVDNGFVIMRNLSKPGTVYKTIDRRYTVYNIFNSYDNSKRYYIIPTEIRTDRKINIHIAEGFFDILSVYLNLINRSEQNICAAINGKSYLNLLTYFIAEMGLFFARYHIYIDNDISDWEIYNIKNLITKFNIEAYIHRNVYNGEKDFGVKRDLITDEVTLVRDI